MSVIDGHGRRRVAHQPHPDAQELKRLLVVDDHLAVRRGLRELLEEQPDFIVVDAVAGAETAISLAERWPLDVAIVDYQLEGRNGLWVSRKLKRLPNPPRVLIYSAYSDGLLAAAAIAAEADGMMSKGSLGSELCDAIRIIASGRTLLPALPQPVGELLRRRLDNEQQVMFGMSRAGIPRREIARIMGLSQSGLESRLWEMLREIESIDGELSGGVLAGAQRRLG